jgi:dCMP deaminase
MRATWDEYFMNMAINASTRSTCDRLHVGAILVKNNRVVGTGYNGSVKGLPHCTDKTELLCNGGCLNTEGRCVKTIHAEVNAILDAKGDTEGATCYATHSPCENCTKLLAQAGVVRVVFLHPYRNPYNEYFIQESGMRWEKYTPQIGSDKNGVND